MNVLIRDVDPQYIKEIDKKLNTISKQRGVKFSRNDYLKLLLRQDSEIDLINYKKSEFDNMLDKILLSNQQLISSVCELTKTYERIFNFLIYTNGGGNNDA